MSKAMPSCAMPFTGVCMRNSDSIWKSMDREHEGNPFPPNTEGKPRHLLHSRSSSFLMNRIWHFSTVWEGRCEMARSVTHYPWEQLAGQIVPEVLQAPKTGGDPNGGWPTVHEHVVGYLVRSVVGTPWANHLALLAAVLAARQRDVQTVKFAVHTLHARSKTLFSALRP